MWAKATRNVLPILEERKCNTSEDIIRLNVDVERWISRDGKEPIENFTSKTEYKLVADHEAIDRAVDSMIRLYGPDRLRWASRLLETKPLEEMWEKCVVLNQVA